MSDNVVSLPTPEKPLLDKDELQMRASRIAHEVYAKTVPESIRSKERVRDETLIALGIHAGLEIGLKAVLEAMERHE